MGGTAVGTGLNAPAGFGEQVAAQIAQMTGTAYRDRGEQVHRPGHAGPDGARARRAEGGGGDAVQDRQRPALARLRPAHRDRRADLPGQRARVLDHAGQGQPDPGRGDADGRHPGHRLRRGGDHGRRRGQLRAERLPPDPDQQLPALGADHGRHVRPLPRVHGRGHQAQRGQAEGEHRPVGDDGHRAVAGHRLRQGRGHLLLRHRPRPHPQAGRPGQGRVRGPVRQGRHPARAHPPRHRRRAVQPRKA